MFNVGRRGAGRIGAALAAAIISVGLTWFGVGASGAIALVPSQTSVSVMAPATVDGGYWHFNYYYNYFYTGSTCNSRGNAIIKKGGPDYIPGASNFSCHVLTGETKWSMDIYFLY